MRAEDKQPQFKDQDEYNLYDSITKDTNPQARLDKLKQWEQKYPSTEWIKARRTLFLTTYVGLNQPKEAAESAKKILADDPKDFTAQYYLMLLTQPLYGASPSPDVLDQGEKASNAIASNIDTAPPNVTPEQWAKLRPDIELLAHVNLGFIAMSRKTWDPAEREFQKSLQLNPNNGQVDYWLGSVLKAEKELAKMPAAIFYLARTAAYDGAGAMPPDFRKQALAYTKQSYKIFHGSDDGFNDVLALAKNSTAPPADFKIVDAGTIAAKSAAEQDAWNKAHPEEAMWKSIKEALTGADGANYFNSSMKDAQVPTLKGKVVKLEPALKPKTILIAMEDGGSGDNTTADATLKFEAPLAGKVDVGTELSFEGVPESYTASPLMVVFNVDKEKIHGWTGKNAPAPVHHPAPKK